MLTRIVSVCRRVVVSSYSAALPLSTRNTTSIVYLTNVSRSGTSRKVPKNRQPYIGTSTIQPIQTERNEALSAREKNTCVHTICILCVSTIFIICVFGGLFR